MEKEEMDDYFSSDYDSEMEWQQAQPKRGGMITMPFIIANEAFERAASFGLLPNMILYLTTEYGMSVVTGTNVLFIWSAANNFAPTIGAFLADSYLGRFITITLGCIISLTGMIGLWLTAMIPKLHPPLCNPKDLHCTPRPASPSQTSVLFASFAIMSVGAGGVRSSSQAFGADQLDKRNDPNNERVLEKYFSWYYVSAALSVLIAVTGIVYVQDHWGWKVGFGIPALLMLLSTLAFTLASSIYIKNMPSKSLITGLAQVVVVAFKNRRLALPPDDSVWYHCEIGSDNVFPTNKLRFLNKACIIRNGEDVSSGLAKNPWNLCTVQQVEELKTLIRVIPIWSSAIMMQVSGSQSSLHFIQASSMDRHITSNFEIPAGSFSVFLILSLTIWIFVYDRIIIPLASKLKGRAVRLGTKERMGIGLFISCIAMVVTALVEHKRREYAIKNGLQNNPGAVSDMSAMWLVPQNCLFGLAEAFNAIGQTEFYYSEFSKSMSSIATSLFGLGMGVASLLATLILNLVDKISSNGGQESWVANDINKAHYDYYFWLLAIFNLVNFLYFLICSWAYGPCVEDDKKKKAIEGEEFPHVSHRPGTPPPGTPIRVFGS